ncbi:unnamed protein product, partial [marine sediment metagenome]
YTNTTGTWHLNETKYPELPINMKVDTFNNLNMTGNVGYWRFNNQSEYGENNTHFYDFSGNGNNGTGVNFDGDEIVDGKFDKGILFEGEYIQIPDSSSLDISSEITISAWINAIAWDGQQVVVTKPYDGSDVPVWFMRNDNDWDGIGLGIYDGSWHFADTGADVITGEWVHLAGTFQIYFPSGILSTVKLTLNSLVTLYKS